MRLLPLLALALGTLAAAADPVKNLTFTEPVPTIPNNSLRISNETIEIRWTIPPESPYAPLNSQARLSFKGPDDVDYLISDPIVFTGVGVTGQAWKTEDFRKKYGSKPLNAGMVYYFELSFTSIDGKPVQGLVEKSELYSLEGIVVTGAAGMVKAGMGLVAGVVGVVGVVVGMGM